jgi:nucleosome assembly protein 1-like 1
LNPQVRKRVYALKKLQLQTIELDAEFHREVYNLEQKFQIKHDEIFKQRSNIIEGIYHPTEEDCQLPGIELKLDESTDDSEKSKGISHFWLAVMKNVTELRNMIHGMDEDILKHLIEIKASSKAVPDLSFQLDFIFAPNDFFSNEVLTKTYLMKCSPDLEDPYSFEGPEIYKADGCKIDWKEGKNVTDAAINPKKSLLPFFKAASFFNFFNPPELKPGDSDENAKIEVS